jgi:hypothetical protein
MASAGLGIYDVVAKTLYGCDLSAERQNESHIRRMEKRLDRIMALAERPLTVARGPDHRIAGRCSSFTLMLVSMLRANGVPARLRCGFAAYFNPPRFEDHWVCEYWDAARRRWVLADAQLDVVWCEKMWIAFDPADVPLAQFLTAAEAWRRCRRGEADPAPFGIDSRARSLARVPSRPTWRKRLPRTAAFAREAAPRKPPPPLLASPIGANEADGFPFRGPLA